MSRKKDAKKDAVRVSRATVEMLTPLIRQAEALKGQVMAFVTGARTALNVPDDWGFDFNRMEFRPPQKKEAKDA